MAIQRQDVGDRRHNWHYQDLRLWTALQSEHAGCHTISFLRGAKSRAAASLIWRCTHMQQQEQLLSREHRKEGAKRKRARGAGARSGSADNEGSSAACAAGRRGGRCCRERGRAAAQVR